MEKSIDFFVNYIGGGWSPWDTFLRGTEDFVRESAVIAVQKGYKVRVFGNGSTYGTYKGFQYLPSKDYDKKSDTLIIIKESSLLDVRFEANRVIYYTNEIDDNLKLTNRRLKRVEKVVALSKWHKDNLLHDIDKVQVVYHGIRPEKYTNPEKIPFYCIYTSSPDRGLYHLREAWEHIKEQIPEAQLEVAYNGKTEAEMDDMYRKADFWLYPCGGGELYCISGIKAQAAGAFPVVVPTMALSETVKFGIKTTVENFARDAVAVMKTRGLVERERKRMQNHKWPTYEEAFDQIIKRGYN